MEWQADSIQAVIFTAPFGPHRDATMLWADVFPGDGPDGFQRNPSSPNLQSSASGERTGHNVTISAQVGQVSVTINPPFKQIPGLSPVSVSPPRIVDVNEALNFVIHSVGAFIPHLSIVRIALITELSKTIPTPATAELMRREIPEVQFPDGSIEVAYQFNSQVPLSSQHKIVMNRICAWNSGQVGFFAGQTPGTQFGGPVIMSNFIGLRIDANTAPDQSLFGIDVVTAFDILRDETLGIAEKQLGHFS